MAVALPYHSVFESRLNVLVPPVILLLSKHTYCAPSKPIMTTAGPK